MKKHSADYYSPENRKARRKAKERRDERLAMTMAALAVPVVYLFFYVI